jgi:hypothetical protein
MRLGIGKRKSRVGRARARGREMQKDEMMSLRSYDQSYTQYIVRESPFIEEKGQ